MKKDEPNATSFSALDGCGDPILMRRFQNGDTASFEVIYTRHERALYRFLLHQAGNNVGLAEDLAHDVWVKVIKSSERYMPSAQFRTFLFHIAHNRLIDHYRAKSEHHESLDAEDEDGQNRMDNLVDECQPCDLLARKQAAAQLRACIQTLPASQREVFLLKEESELSLTEVAELIGVSFETVKSRMRYALDKLRVCVDISK